MYGILRAIKEGERLSLLREKLKPAELRGMGHCVRCGFCCKQRVCIPTPNEIPKIAKYLKLTTRKLVQKYMAVDQRGESHFFLRWIASNIQGCAGKIIPWDRTYDEGNCVFLKNDNKCQIYRVRPKDAQTLQCWEKNPKTFNPIDEWQEKDIEKFGFNLEKLESGGLDGRNKRRIESFSDTYSRSG